MQTARIRAIEGRCAIHPHANGDGDEPVAAVFGEQKVHRHGAVGSHMVALELAKGSDHLPVDEDLIGVVHLCGHLQR